MTKGARSWILCRVLVFVLFVRESTSIFFNKTSYIRTKPLDISKQFLFTFRTCRGGTLLLQHGANNEYFKLSVVPAAVNYTTGIFTQSSLSLTWRTAGHKDISSVNIKGNFDQNGLHQVIFSPTNDNHNTTLSVGIDPLMKSVGVPDAIMRITSTNLTLGEGFVGCISFGDMFDLRNLYENVSTSRHCPLDDGKRCVRPPCRDGFKGYYCHIDIDECASSPCHHAATCINKIANFTCVCGPTWTGQLCTEPRDEKPCDVRPCQNGGICHHTSNLNNYTCTCHPPFDGRNCTEVSNPCKSAPCLNNGTCENITSTYFQCKCPKGFTGKRCEENINDCVHVDCGHGLCVDGIGSHFCNCTNSGYTGKTCIEDINECDDSPCMHNATCQNYAGSYLCTCVGDYEGKNCEKQIDDCAGSPCSNGGNCTDLVKDFKCVCPRGFSGKRCDALLHPCNVHGCSACDSKPCIHGNCSCTCLPYAMFYNCSCEATGFLGVNCSEDINECWRGSIPSRICGDNGTCRNTNGSFQCECKEGFTGRYCNETKGPCNPNPCLFGSCRTENLTTVNMTQGGNVTVIKEDYNCSCFAGWRGRNCDVDIDECKEGLDKCNRTTSECSNTKGSYRCICNSGYGGEFCNDDIDECRTVAPCINGRCENIVGSYECFCRDGFRGKNCSEDIDDCLLGGNAECRNGVCKDGVRSFTCLCQVGWRGRHCGEDINECSLGYCRNNATCNNTAGNYSCTCVPGFTGRNCSTDIDDCEGSPCQNGGICYDKVNDYECNCSRAYEGKSCEIDIDWCNVTRNHGSEPCDFGICQDQLLNHTCDCFEGFIGPNCSIDVDECASLPCENGATCVQRSNVSGVRTFFGVNRVYPKNESGGYLCVCQLGYNGTNCENNIEECLLYHPCNVTGTESCVDGVNNYTCRCKKGFKGRNCSEDINECSSSPCLNNATCQDLIGQFKCICNSNFTGDRCQSRVDPCTALSPCQNGGVCSVTTDFNFTCICAEGFAGASCANRTTLGFGGTSSMTINIADATLNISFSFRTIFSEGVLMSESDSWTVALTSGNLQLIPGNSIPCLLGILGTVSDNRWHLVRIYVNNSKILAETEFGKCDMDFVTTSGIRSRSRRAVPSGRQLLIGATSGDSDRSNFRGSIRDVTVNDQTYYPGVSGVVLDNVDVDFQRRNVCSPDPCVNGKCNDLWTRYSCECDKFWTAANCTQGVLWGTFGTINQLNNGYKSQGNQSYAMYSISSTFEELTFTMRTRSESSLIALLYLNMSTYLSIEVFGGTLRLRGRNRGKIFEQKGIVKINDALQHHVIINRTVIGIDGAHLGVTVMSFPLRKVFLGGVPGDIAWEKSTGTKFRGCLRDVRVNGEQLLFFNQTSKHLNYTQVNIAQNCSGEDVCGRISGLTPCSNGGNCSDLWNAYNCTCQFPYGGDNCELYGCELTNPCPANSSCVNVKEAAEFECISQVTFNDSQSLAFFKNSTPLSNINTLVVQLRTRQNNTVILSSGDNHSSFNILVQEGYLMVLYNFAENLTGHVNTDARVSDGNWYELKISTTADRTKFEIFVMEFQGDKFNYINSNLFVRNISLLNNTFARLLSSAGVYVGSSQNLSNFYLLGCVREVRVGKHLLNFATNISLDWRPGFSPAQSSFAPSQLQNVRTGCRSNPVCTSSLCGNGSCIEDWNDFRCECLRGFHGNRCQFNPCTPSPCVKGACTVRGANEFECKCPTNYVGRFCNKTCTVDFCNKTCTVDFCKNGGTCTTSGGTRTCVCESNWTGKFCESSLPRKDDDDNENLALIIGLAVGGAVLLLLIVVVLFVCTRQTSSTFGTYSPSSEEKAGNRVEMNPVLNVPPPEKLI